MLFHISWEWFLLHKIWCTASITLPCFYCIQRPIPFSNGGTGKEDCWRSLIVSLLCNYHSGFLPFQFFISFVLLPRGLFLSSEHRGTPLPHRSLSEWMQCCKIISQRILQWQLLMHTLGHVFLKLFFFASPLFFGKKIVLVIADRSIDLSVMLAHPWTYQALIHELLEYKMNKVKVWGWCQFQFFIHMTGCWWREKERRLVRLGHFYSTILAAKCWPTFYSSCW